MRLSRHVPAILGALTLTLPGCTTSKVSAPKFDLVTPLLATWAGRPGTLEFRQDGQFLLRGGEVTTGTWAPIDDAYFKISQPKQQSCAYAVSDGRLLITGCLLAGEYFRVRH